MRILIAGGVFRLSVDQRGRRQPAPEVLLVKGLREHGVDAVECPLEDLRTVTWDRSFDLVHVHHLSKAAVAASLSPLPRPMAFTEHGMPAASSTMMQAARRLIYARAAGVVCLSERERAAKVREFRLATERAFVIPNPATLVSAGPSLREPAPGRLRLLYVGQLIPLKQVDRIVRALPALPTAVTLRLVYHNDALATELAHLAEQLGVRERVEFVGQLSGEALGAAYREADVLLLPSVHEALPSVISEALLTGLPVIASRVGGIPEQVSDAGLLVSPDASAPLDSAIQQVLRGYPGYAEAAYKRAIQITAQLAPSASIDAHIAFYQQLLREG